MYLLPYTPFFLLSSLPQFFPSSCNFGFGFLSCLLVVLEQQFNVWRMLNASSFWFLNSARIGKRGKTHVITWNRVTWQNYHETTIFQHGTGKFARKAIKPHHISLQKVYLCSLKAAWTLTLENYSDCKSNLPLRLLQWLHWFLSQLSWALRSRLWHTTRRMTVLGE